MGYSSPWEIRILETDFSLPQPRLLALAPAVDRRRPAQEAAPAPEAGRHHAPWRPTPASAAGLRGAPSGPRCACRLGCHVPVAPENSPRSPMLRSAW